MARDQSKLAKLAFKFVLTIGIVNLFADMTYEGARSITGPFLQSLGATALAVGLIAGGGELFGYVLRSVAGYLADKTQRYWIVIIIGYAINMLVVPALALAGNWPMAAVLIMAERTGRGIRKPATDAMLSYAGKSIGRASQWYLKCPPSWPQLPLEVRWTRLTLQSKLLLLSEL